MKSYRRIWLLGAAAMALTVSAAGAQAQDVEAGVRAWQAENYDEAVRQWRPLAERGDRDAMFNLGHAFRLGRGVPQNMQTATHWYERAARANHPEAQAMYGVLLFQNGRRREAMPWLEQGARAGDPRAQYIYGTALFNGELVQRDWPRAFAMMTLAADSGLPPAATQLRNMEQYLSAADRQRGVQLAQQMRRGPALADASPPPRAVPQPPRVAQANPPAGRTPTPVPARPRPAETERPAARAPAPAPAASPSGWRVQLGAFGEAANARRHWDSVRGRVAGLGNLTPFLVRAGAMTRLQAGPLPNRAAAERICASIRSGGGACFVVAP